MPLYRVALRAAGGSQVTCRVHALVDHATLITLAAQKIWGADAVWVGLPSSDTEGRVYERVGDDEDDLPPRTGVATGQITPVSRRPRGPQNTPSP